MINVATITKLDHFGRGITYLDNKITFVSNALENEEVVIKKTVEKKKYNEAIATEIKKASPNRVIEECPYYLECGGCSLQHLKYEATLDFKKQKVQEILQKYANLTPDIKIIANPKPYHYRNKLSLKIKDGKLGFYEPKTHKLVAISKCLLAEEAINDFLQDYQYLNLVSAEMTIRTNYNIELLISINTKDKISIDYDYLSKKHKIVGIVVNDKCIYGDDKFIEILNHKLFQISYNSFFQVNRHVTSEIFKILEKNIAKDAIVADLFCGVGSLSLIAAEKAQKVYGIEVVPNAILNALTNKKINKQENMEFCLGDANEQVLKIKDKIDTIIVDPPRSGLTPKGIASLLQIKPETIIYISCDPMTLARDLKLLNENYQLQKIYIADMFSYTYHVESICVLKIKC